ncbi:polysaccharide deacetylase family protein [Clostridiaceae bacterium 35-E11]
MKKHIIFLILLTILSVPSESFGFNENLNSIIYIVVNEELITFEDTYPTVKHGTTYVPIKFLAQAFAVDVQWDHTSNNVFLTKGNKQITLDLKVKALFTSEGQIITDSVFIENNRTMAPYKFIANFFGYEVSYIPQGPIARAKNQGAVTKDEELFDKMYNKILQEKKKIIDQIKRREAARKNQEAPKVAYVTFDDGPTKYTENILKILNEYNCKATFFMLGDRIQRHKNIVKEVSKQGNAIGLHGVTHDIKAIYKSPSNVVSEMNQCNYSLQQATGKRSNLIRVPYGSKPYMTRKYRNAIEKAGYKMWDWNVDSKDSLKQNIRPILIVENVKQQVKKQKTPVILLHERQSTVEALPKILKYLKENGYNVVPIDKEERPKNFWNGRS